jgi:hypothetical protein
VVKELRQMDKDDVKQIRKIYGGGKKRRKMKHQKSIWNMN